jgi:hypothetical protein
MELKEWFEKNLEGIIQNIIKMLSHLEEVQSFPRRPENSPWTTAR